jgi:hypothetical protein
MEMLAYMPAFWMMKTTDQTLLAFEPLSHDVSRSQALWFLGWMTVFNGYEDVVSTITLLRLSGITLEDTQGKLFVVSHFVHLMLVLDFCALFAQQAYVSKVAKNESAPSKQLEDATADPEEEEVIMIKGVGEIRRKKKERSRESGTMLSTNGFLIDDWIVSSCNPCSLEVRKR